MHREGAGEREAGASDSAYGFPLTHRELEKLGIGFFVRPQPDCDRTQVEFKWDAFTYGAAKKDQWESKTAVQVPSVATVFRAVLPVCNRQRAFEIWCQKGYRLHYPQMYVVKGEFNHHPNTKDNSSFVAKWRLRKGGERVEGIYLPGLLAL